MNEIAAAPAGRAPGLGVWAFLLAGLSLSIGWGVRGNWGHEYGAMIPGALTAIAVAACSNRPDWHARIPFFALFGALGWSFGGSISYMIVISYTQSGHYESQAYGYACLFVIGFLWAALGGAGTAMPAELDRKRLTSFVAPTIAVIVAWYLVFAAIHFAKHRGWITEESLDWYDTDWIAAATAAPVALAYLLFSPAHRVAAGLYLVMALGWWAGFGGLVLGAGLRMTPPRGDNWAGVLGMTVATLLYFAAMRKPRIVLAMLISGFVGGWGFAGMQLVKIILIYFGDVYLVERGWIKEPFRTNYHSILEQSYGFVNGLGIALAMGVLSTRSPRWPIEKTPRRWTDLFAVAFVLIGITYVNIVKNLSNVWREGKVIPETIYGLSASTWFHLGYLALAAALVAVLIRHARRPVALGAASGLVKGQILYIVFLWWIVAGNFTRVLPFHEQRIVTEGTIHFGACLATALILILPRDDSPPGERTKPGLIALFFLTIVLGLLGTAATTAVEMGLTRKMYGDERVHFGNLHIRFGPNNTNTKHR